MIIHDVQQGTPAWDQLRIGIPTASEFDKIITPGGEPSKQWDAYANKILAEEMVGHAIETFKSTPMQEGNDREAESVAYYEFQRNVTTTPVGFVTDDARTMGCSPDRLIGTDGILETKNPLAHTHVGYLIDGKLDKGYWPQLQGQLLVTGRKWVDIVSYFPELPELIVRVARDEPYLEAMDRQLKAFFVKLQAKRQKLINGGYIKGSAKAPEITKPPATDKNTLVVDEIIAGLKGLNKVDFNAYMKKRSEEISNITLRGDDVNRARLAAAINEAKARVEDPSRFLNAG